jgi:hypothetical protein
MIAIAGLSALVYLDENAPPLLVSDLGRSGFDVVHAWDVGNRGVEDEVHLRWAASRGRALFSSDVEDFSMLASRWSTAGTDHAGIILATQVRRGEYGQLLRRFIAMLD